MRRRSSTIIPKELVYQIIKLCLENVQAHNYNITKQNKNRMFLVFSFSSMTSFDHGNIAFDIACVTEFLHERIEEAHIVIQLDRIGASCSKGKGASPTIQAPKNLFFE